MKFPDSLIYSKNHIWLKKDKKNNGVIGVTDYAQEELGDVVFVELPQEGEEYNSGEIFGTIESMKTVSDLYMPIKGEVISVNEKLMDNPELINNEPYSTGWIIKIQLEEEEINLLSAEEYRNVID